MADNWEGKNQTLDKAYYNRFIYDMDTHTLYATVTTSIGRLGIMGGLRGEYWKVNTESYSYEQEHNPTKRDQPFKKDYFQLFPSLFLNYQLTESAQIQLNYTRRLRRPWGGQLNSFKNTSDASMVSFGFEGGGFDDGPSGDFNSQQPTDNRQDNMQQQQSQQQKDNSQQQNNNNTDESATN